MKITRLAAFSLFSVAFLAVMAGGRVPDWFETPKHTYAILPPFVVGNGPVDTAAWASDGAHLLVAFHPVTQSPSALLDQALASSQRGAVDDRGAISLRAWSRATGTAREVWKSDTPGMMITSIDWLPRSDLALVSVWMPETDPARIALYGPMAMGVLMIDARTGTYKWLPGAEHVNQSIEIYPSSLEPLAVIQIPETVASQAGSAQAAIPAGSAIATSGTGTQRNQTPVTYLVVDGRGQIIRRIESLEIFRVDWSADGKRWLDTYTDRRSKKLVVKALADDGTLKVVSDTVYVPPSTNPEMWVSTDTKFAKRRNLTRRYNNVWLSSPEATQKPDVLVTADGKSPLLSPANDGVFYVEGGIGKVRSLVALSDDQKQALVAAAKAQAISDAKQCGLALIMYSGDADDQLPLPGGSDTIGPYLKNQEIEDDCVYTPPSNLNMTQIERPAETVMGYVPGPGGRAVIFTDGHVRWQPNS